MSEADEQKEIVRWFRAQYPEHAMSLRISQTGGHIGKGRSAAIRNSQSRAMGRVNGESDIAILLPRGGYGALLIEHKAKGSAHKATPEQIAYVEYHNNIGNCACITRGVDAATAAIKTYIEATQERL